MAGFEKTFSFRFLPNKSFSAFAAKSTQEYFLKWGLSQRMKLQAFSYDKYFQAYEKENFVMSFFQDAAVKENFQASSSSDVWGCRGDIKVDKVEIELVPSSITNMGFFDKVYEKGLVRDSGSICKCYDEQIQDFLISDELRKMVLSDESDFYDLFSEKERQEFIFRIFTHLCLGGQVCQYEDEIGPYLETAKFIYKDLVSVHKDTKTQELVVSSIVLKVSLWAEETMLFPSSEEHTQSFAYFIINPVKRNVVVWHHSWRS